LSNPLWHDGRMKIRCNSFELVIHCGKMSELMDAEWPGFKWFNARPHPGSNLDLAPLPREREKRTQRSGEVMRFV
jgi:hypothetical protein